MFCHALIRDGAYASLLHKRRAPCTRAPPSGSRRATSSSPPSTSTAPTTRVPPPPTSRASDAVAAQFRHAAALALVERGLALAAEQATRFALLMARGRLLVELGRSGDAIDAAAPRSPSPPSAERAGAGADRDGRGHAPQRPHRRRPGRARRGRAARRRRGRARSTLSRLHHLRGNLLLPARPRTHECLREHDLARDHARAAGSLEAEAAAIGGLGDALLPAGPDALGEPAVPRVRRARARARLRPARGGEPVDDRLDRPAPDRDRRRRSLSATRRSSSRCAPRSRAPRSWRARWSRWVDGLIRDRRDEAEQQNGRRRSRSSRASAPSASRRSCSACAHAARCARGERGQRTRARARKRSPSAAATAWATSVRGRTAFCALIETDPDARRRWLDEGERQLALGCVSHNHVQLRELAIDALLEIGDWDGVERELRADPQPTPPTSRLASGPGRA